MSNHTEWMDAKYVDIEYGDYSANGIDSDGPALILAADNFVAIEGTADELTTLAHRILAAVEAGPNVEF